MAYLSTAQSLRPARRSIFALIGDLTALYRQRRELAQMSDVELSDIGLTRAQAEAEAARPIWDFPRR
ncbi:DUF1127 domain-containing protein [Epibacterium ulvae]|uniref:DUF1127 domain-containing protein n=1 Tax=Epibacterium ulvae TaxID=1156985 RepID=UPI001BFC7DE9|nr:DUF1127 domain-containing protein [Epibacterium ulvae]MBT8155582.1 DUF1127 domain-containing protein [Epibacterium ulvae]